MKRIDLPRATAAKRPSVLRRAALAASILLALALLATWLIQAQLSRTRGAVTPAVAAAAASSEAEAAISEASDFGRQRTVDTLVETLDEDDPDGYLDTIRWLSKLDPEQTMAILIGRLAEAERSDDPVAASRRRALAAQGLGALSDARAVEALSQALASDDRKVRIAAAKSLQQIRRDQRLAEEPESPPDPRPSADTPIDGTTTSVSPPRTAT